MNPYTLSPYVRLAMYDQIQTDFHLDREIWDHEIIYIAKGKMILRINEERYECVEGDILFLRPGVHHYLDYAGEVTIQPHVHFDFYEDEYSKDVYVSLIRRDQMKPHELKWFREDYLKKVGIELPPVIKLNNSYAIKNILYRLIDEFNYHYPFSEFMMQGLLVELLSEIVRGYYLSTKTSSLPHMDKLEDLVKFIYKNIEKNLSLDDLCAEINLSKFHLIRVFKDYFGVTPIKYINELKLNRARELLQFTKLSIKEISYMLSFDSQHSFTRWFTKLDTKPPISYRKSNYK